MAVVRWRPDYYGLTWHCYEVWTAARPVAERYIPICGIPYTGIAGRCESCWKRSREDDIVVAC